LQVPLDGALQCNAWVESSIFWVC